jgi:Myb-like DNA-binding protein REB1
MVYSKFQEFLLKPSKKEESQYQNKYKNFKKGPFSKIEKNLVDKSLKQVLEEEGIRYNLEGAKKIFSLARKELPKNFWGKVAQNIPLRRVESIYDHARRRLSMKNYQGKWNNEEIEKLGNLVKIYGFQWTKIGTDLNRLPGACYDKWRDALKNGEKRKKGTWSQEEKCKLIQLVTKQLGHDLIQEGDGFGKIKWTLVANKIKTRSYLQCRNEWSRFFTAGSKVKLTLSDSLRLIEAIFLLQVIDESEIKWGNLLHGVPAHKTYNKWRSLCQKYLKERKKYDFQISFRCAISFLRNKLLKILNNNKF